MPFVAVCPSSIIFDEHRNIFRMTRHTFPKCFPIFPTGQQSMKREPRAPPEPEPTPEPKKGKKSPASGRKQSPKSSPGSARKGARAPAKQK